ncbi:MAG TPA: cytochrome c peroxidase [Chloroflexia bacterium]|jgi:cytochrome c peroxidase
MKPLSKLLVLASVVLVAIGTIVFAVWPRMEWSDEERIALSSLWIGNLGPLPADSSNKVVDDDRAVRMGHRLFFDNRLSANGAVSCATCHMPERNFNDNLPLAKGVGTTTRKTMTIVGAAYSPWQFWDGRKDSLWAQALGPLENPVEHGGSRTQYAHLIDEFYRTEYEALFGPLPDFSDRTRFPEKAGPVDDPVAAAAWKGMTDADRNAVTRVYSNLGKAIAAYERRIVPGPSRFDRYIEALLENDASAMKELLTPSEVAGAKLFISQAQCINCHNGPLLMGTAFHNTGVPAAVGLPEDRGRLIGVQQVLEDEFNCLSEWSDAPPEDCAELRFVVRSGEQLDGAFKPPTLRNIAQTAPYMHAGQFAALTDVLKHYSEAKPGPVGHSELQPLGLSSEEVDHLIAFLGSLSGPLAAPPELLRPPAELQASQ